MEMTHDPYNPSCPLARGDGACACGGPSDAQALRARVAELESLAERRRQERLEALSVTTREGISASEWVLRTGKAEQRAAELGREVDTWKRRTEWHSERAATLQAEVERLKADVAFHAGAAAAERDAKVEARKAIASAMSTITGLQEQVQSAGIALAESERKRAILVKALDEESWRLIESAEAE